jgi:hypothetical protein
MIISVIHRLSSRNNRSTTSSSSNQIRRLISTNKWFGVRQQQQQQQHYLYPQFRNYKTNNNIRFLNTELVRNNQHQHQYHINQFDPKNQTKTISTFCNSSNNQNSIMLGLDNLTLRWLLCGIISNNGMMIRRTTSLVFGSNTGSFGSSSISGRHDYSQNLNQIRSFSTTTKSDIPFLVNQRRSKDIPNERSLSTTSTTALSASSSSSSSKSSPISGDDNTAKGQSSSLHASTSLSSTGSSVIVDQVSDTTTTSTTTVETDTIQILAHENDFIKPDCDKRQYRTLVLPNNLQVLLVSDMMTSGVGIEAASVHVRAGHFDDSIPGLARTFFYICSFCC